MNLVQVGVFIAWAKLNKSETLGTQLQFLNRGLITKLEVGKHGSASFNRVGSNGSGPVQSFQAGSIRFRASSGPILTC